MKKDSIVTMISTGIILFVLMAAAFAAASLPDGVLFCAGPIYQGDGTSKRMAFMCNVYWGNEYIEPILEILKEYGVRITFFIGGTWARDNDELLRAIAAAGHEIGNHGYYHYDHSRLSEQKSLDNIARNHELIRDRLGVEMNLFAPPSGAFTSATVGQAESLGYRTILWSIDTIDWRDTDPDLLIRRVWEKRRAGALVLMHPTAQTVKALAVLIRDLLADGYELTTVGDMIQ
ncbi:MAG: polysaccharide deacetylase family protein [Eubacteriales bacterium]|nr:polysaccharide deacetylase family protein [Eubacteriales bacterium]